MSTNYKQLLEEIAGRERTELTIPMEYVKDIKEEEITIELPTLEAVAIQHQLDAVAKEDKVRLKARPEYLDRLLGKPKQEVEIQEPRTREPIELKIVDKCEKCGYKPDIEQYFD
ncbi:MAG: hypothetical protein OXE77_07860 [Flavobacteriaceae bacterium]|nr:hypothetical protein [Flavobacteriaceae bacterium]